MLFHEQHFFTIHEQHKIKTEIFIRQHALFQDIMTFIWRHGQASSSSD